jgi:hypothetical protein
MPLVAPDEGEILLLQYIVNMTPATDPVLHLYNNTDLTITDSVTIADITEASAAGYAAITLTGGSWTTVQSGGVTTAEYSEQTFAFTTGASLYGYYVTDTSDNLLWLEEFSGAPFTLPSGGGTIAITSKITLD